MSEINQPTSQSMTMPLNPTSRATNGLSLYDQYGAVAYGVILRIVPQSQSAQEILIDVFASPELQTAVSSSGNRICNIVRLARDKALAYRHKQLMPVPSKRRPTNQSELIFDLLFYQNQTPEAIADRLQIDRSAVLKAVREFFAYLPPS